MEKNHIILVLFLLLFINSVFAVTPTLIGGFETGDFTDWEYIIVTPSVPGSTEVNFNEGAPQGNFDVNVRTDSQSSASVYYFYTQILFNQEDLQDFNIFANIECTDFCLGTPGLLIHDFNTIPSLSGVFESGDIITSVPSFGRTFETRAPTGCTGHVSASKIKAKIVANEYDVDVNALGCKESGLANTWPRYIGFQSSQGENFSEMHFDNIRITIPELSNLSLVFNDPQPLAEAWNLRANFVDSLGDHIPGATCTLTGVTNQGFTDTGSFYEIDVDFNFAQTYNFSVGCHKNLFSDSNVSDSVTVVIDLVSNLDVNNISNVTNTVTAFEVILQPTNLNNDIEWCVNNFGGNSLDVPYTIRNSQKVYDKYYSIFTATQLERSLGIWNFNDTLSIGSGQTSGIQTKFRSNRFEYKFTDFLSIGQEKCYKAVRIDVDGTQNLDNLDWSLTANRAGIDFNGIIFDSMTLNSFNNFEAFKKSLLIDENSGQPTNYAFVWNAFRDGNFNNVNTRVFEKNEGISTDFKEHYEITSVNESSYLTTFNKTFSTASHLFMDSNNSNIAVLNFALPKLLKRGFFDESIRVVKPDNSSLDLFIDGNQFFKYVREGDPFRVQTHINAWDNELSRVNLRVYLDSVDLASNNLVYQDTIDFDDSFGFFDIDFLVDNGILDLNANSPNRQVHVVVQAINIKNKIYEIQEQSFTLLQFPHFPNDLRLFITEDNREVGQHPAGSIRIEIDTSDKLDGLHLIVTDDDPSTDTLDFNVFFWKDQDFTCSVFSCEFNYEIEDYIFPKSGVYTFKLVALVTTEVYNADNDKLFNQFSVHVGFKELDLAQLFQTYERQSFTYTNSELVPVVLKLRSSNRENLKDKFDIKIQATDCDANSTGTCDNIIDLNYTHDGFLYDLRTGENFWFYRKIFTTEGFGLLSDGNYYRIFATLTSSDGQYSSNEQPVLASKCRAKDYGSFMNFASVLLITLENAISNNCNTVQHTTVSLQTNANEEQRILIDNNVSLTAPNQEMFLCWADSNATYIKDRLLCAVLYSSGDIPIDKLKISIGNNFSDFSEREYRHRQSLEFEIPYELIAFNDMVLLKKALEVKYNTPIDTIGRAVMYGFNHLASQYGSGIAEQGFKLGHVFNNPEDFNNFVIYNYDVDVNFNDAFNPDSVTGVIFFEINDITLINALHEKKLDEELAKSSTNKLLKTADVLGVDIASETSNIKVYVSDMIKIIDRDIEVNLVEEFENPIAVDVEGISVIKPNLFTLQVVSDLVYSSIKADRLFLTITFASFQKAPFNVVLVITEGIGDLVFDPVAWLINNWFFIVLLIILIYVFSRIYRNFAGSGGQNVQILNRIPAPKSFLVNNVPVSKKLFDRFKKGRKG